MRTEELLTLPCSCEVFLEASLKDALHVAGLWLGLLVCVTLQSTFFIVVLWKLDWRKAAEEVSDHVFKLILLTDLTDI